MSAVTVREINTMLEKLAPPALAESWDNVGLLVGDGAQQLTTVLVALDITPAVLDQAAEHKAELLVTHHPLIFSGIKRVAEDGASTSLLMRMIRENRSLISLHTNLDSAPEGLNTFVASMLGLENSRPLVPSAARPLLKLVVFVPETHVEKVRYAICEAGAGHIGHYDSCTFSVPGTGTFRGEEGTNPYIGKPGELESVSEMRLETIAPKSSLGPILSAMFATHPYEEVAFDLIPLENNWPGAGIGRIGCLPAETTAGEVLKKVGEVLQTDRLSIVGDGNRKVKTIALCTGGGGDYLSEAISNKADLFLTGEIKHHQALIARQQGISLIAAGHFATERPAVKLLAEYLRATMPTLQVVEAIEEDPLQR